MCSALGVGACFLFSAPASSSSLDLFWLSLRQNEPFSSPPPRPQLPAGQGEGQKRDELTAGGGKTEEVSGEGGLFCAFGVLPQDCLFKPDWNPLTELSGGDQEVLPGACLSQASWGLGPREL